MLSFSCSLSAEVKLATNPNNQLQGWTLTESNLELKVAQILPDQNRAFLMARGFPKEIANDIAKSCVMQTVAKNVADTKNAKAITIKLKDWQIKIDGEQNEKIKGVKLKEIWDSEWKSDDIATAARIAFRWATFPTEQTFEPHGDYNWGITSFGLPPSSIFDLNVVWYEGENKKSAWIHNIMCAEDK